LSGDLGRELEVAVRAVRLAAAAILEHRARPTVTIKPDGSPVTSADLAADAILRATVREAFPGDALLTEEGADDRARLSSRRLWIGDPLDGTRYFVGGRDDFDTFLALAVDGIPVVAVTLQPVTGLLLGAVAGAGAWRQEGGGPRRQLLLQPGTPPRLATKGWLGAPGNVATLERVAAELGARVIQPDFSLCPRAFLPPSPTVDAMVGLPVTAPLDAWEWDVAPIDLIVREAGGAASGLTGASLRYNQPSARFADGLIIAADRSLHRQLVDCLGSSAPAAS
jgi:3'-phosphoadenosine 5'-phosphosulfate (PAPS) 3'-phosphatase